MCYNSWQAVQISAGKPLKSDADFQRSEQLRRSGHSQNPNQVVIFLSWKKKTTHSMTRKRTSV